MAYNKSYNPDALPAHAEPEQVAQMIGSMQVSGPGNQSQSHKPLPSRPPQSGPSGVPPRVPVASTTPKPYGSPAPRPQEPHAPHSYNGRPSPANPLPSQQRPHPLHPSPPPQNYGFEHELGSALVNGDYTSFHPHTVKVMIRMFDKDGNGSINFDEFVSLWKYLAAWRELFDRFDEDRSGRISLPEFEKALVAFGYRLSPQFVSVIFTVFESKTKQMSGVPKSPVHNGMSFDLFVQACISLKRMTDVFKRYDDDRDGYITVSFEEFLTEILQLQD
ncbi:hypothetical protein N7448_010404 [Penicillium atrosanguineum]|nr:hypothetical protein N7448_010404 [Penicillium atrosanguineum]